MANFANIKLNIAKGFSRGTDPTKLTSFLNSDNINGRKVKPGGRRGEMMILDGSKPEDIFAKEKQLIGDGGYMVQYHDLNKKPIRNAVVECNGRYKKTDPDGFIYWVDEYWLEKEEEYAKEIEEELHNYAKRCRTDACLARMCNLSLSDTMEICAPGGLKKTGLLPDGAEDSFEELDKANCLPSISMLYPPGSQAEATAYSKLLYILRLHSPAIKPKSETMPHPQHAPEVGDISNNDYHGKDVAGSLQYVSDKKKTTERKKLGQA